MVLLKENCKILISINDLKQLFRHLVLSSYNNLAFEINSYVRVDNYSLNDKVLLGIFARVESLTPSEFSNDELITAREKYIVEFLEFSVNEKRTKIENIRLENGSRLIK
jgi:hypothetical protein